MNKRERKKKEEKKRPFERRVKSCHLLVLLGAHHILHVSRIRVNPKCYNNTRPYGTIPPSYLEVLWFESRPTGRVL